MLCKKQCTYKPIIEFYFTRFNEKIIKNIRLYHSHIENTTPTVFPIISYFNADLEKDEAIKQNRKKSGIYRWTNLVNNKTYVGSSVDLSMRFKHYSSYSYISKIKRNFPINSALLK